MKKALLIINQMQEERIFERYAIGGGIATLFYTEPILTFDLDVFVILKENSEEMILSLSPLYEWLGQKKYQPLGEHIVIEGVPVQFIPVYNDLVKEAVKNAVENKYEGIETLVLRPEYLIAIMLQTNRAKDRERILRLLEQAEISYILLEKILTRHNLKTIYVEFRKKFYD